VLSEIVLQLRINFSRSCSRSSSAVAEWPHDALCMSVVSFKSTIFSSAVFLLLVISVSYLPMRTIKLCSVLFSVLHAGCDKQDSLMRGSLRGKRTSSKCYLLLDGRPSNC